MAIQKLIKDKTDAFVEIGAYQIYMAPISERKAFTNDSQRLSFRDLFLKVDELVDAINKSTEKG